MITTRTVPQATASATTETLLVEVKEKCCRPYCINGLTPSMSVSFTAGVVSVVDGVAIVPIVATTTVVTPSTNGCGCAHTQVFTERFNVALNSTTANTITLSTATTPLVEPDDVKCCKASSVKLSTTLVVTIA